MKEVGDLLSAYGCERLEDLVASGRRLKTLVIAALLERGRAMHPDQVAERLIEAGYSASRDAAALAREIVRRSRDLDYGYRMSVFRGPDGRLGLDVHSFHLRSTVDGLRPSVPFPPKPTAPETQPLTRAELRAAVDGFELGHGLSVAETIAAVLDSGPRPLGRRAITTALSSAGVVASSLGRLDSTRPGRSRLLSACAGDRFDFRAGADLAAMRRRVRRLGYRRGCDRAGKIQSDNYFAQLGRREIDAEYGRRVLAEVPLAVIHAAPTAVRPKALAVIDVLGRRIETLGPGDLESAGELLERFDILVGFSLPETLHALGLDWEGWHLVRLDPFPATRRSADGRRRVAVTAARLASATLGVELTPAARYRRLAGAGEWDALRGALAEDARVVHHLYRLGRLHQELRANTRKEPWVFYRFACERILRPPAHSGHSELDLVVGAPPELENPWGRAQRVTPLQGGACGHVVAQGNRVYFLDRFELHAWRPAAEGSEASRQGSLAEERDETRVRAVEEARSRVMRVSIAGDEAAIAALEEPSHRANQEALVNLLIERPQDTALQRLFLRLQRDCPWLFGGVLEWMVASPNIPPALRTFASRQLLRDRPALGPELLASGARFEEMLDALDERLTEWLGWSPHEDESHVGYGTPAALVWDIEREVEYGTACLNAYKLARHRLRIPPAAANADLILLLEPGPLRDLLAFELLDEETLASGWLLERARDGATDPELRRLYARASVLIHTARTNPRPAPAAQARARAWSWQRSPGGSQRLALRVPVASSGTLVAGRSDELGLPIWKIVVEIAAERIRAGGAPAAEPPLSEDQEPFEVLVDVELGEGDSVQKISITPGGAHLEEELAGVREIPIVLAARRLVSAFARALPGASRTEVGLVLKAASLVESVVPGASLPGTPVDAGMAVAPSNDVATSS